MNIEVIDKESIKPLYLQIREWLMHEAEKNPEFRFPSERELCRLYGVSRPTVQKALSYFVENDLIVRRPGIGTMIRKGRSISPEAITAVKVVIRSDWVNWEDDLYFARILAGILACIRNNNRQLTIQQYSDKVQHLLLDSPEICSLWLSPEVAEIDAMKTLAQNGHKVIAINREIDYPNISYSTTDHEMGARMAVKYLLEKGHRDILFVGSLLDHQINEKRYQGFLAAQRDVSLIPSFMPVNIASVDFRKDLEEQLKNVFSAVEKPSAIFLSNGHLQTELVDILDKLGLNMPEDVSVVSYDDFEDISERLGMTVVRQQLSKISKRAFKAIHDQETVKEKVKPAIIERRSVKSLT